MSSSRYRSNELVSLFRQIFHLRCSTFLITFYHAAAAADGVVGDVAIAAAVGVVGDIAIAAAVGVVAAAVIAAAVVVAVGVVTRYEGKINTFSVKHKKFSCFSRARIFLMHILLFLVYGEVFKSLETCLKFSFSLEK